MDPSQSEDDSGLDYAQGIAGSPDGVRRSGRPKSNKLRRANLKNDKLVSSTLNKLEIGDASSDEGADDQESDEDEGVKESRREKSSAKDPTHDVAMQDGASDHNSKIKEDHKILLRQMGSNFAIRYRFLDLKSNPEFKDLPEDYKNNLRAWYSYNSRLNQKQKEVKVPKALVPNLLLAGHLQRRRSGYQAGKLSGLNPGKVCRQKNIG